MSSGDDIIRRRDDSDMVWCNETIMLSLIHVRILLSLLTSGSKHTVFWGIKSGKMFGSVLVVQEIWTEVRIE